jgi:hypothetical protein
VARLLDAYGLTVGDVTASGRGGQLLKGDVLKHVAEKKLKKKTEAVVEQTASSSSSFSGAVQYCEHVAVVGPVVRELLAAAGPGGVGALAAVAAGRAGRLGLGDAGRPTRVEWAAATGQLVRGLAAAEASVGEVARRMRGEAGADAEVDGQPLFGVRDLSSSSGVRGRGGLGDDGLRALLTVGALERRVAVEGGVETVLSLSLAYDVAIEESEAHQLLLRVAKEYASPLNV